MDDPRTYLFVPADRPERLAKALAGAADVVIVDLEDGVAETAKTKAREAVAEFFASGVWQPSPGRRIVLRTNAVDSGPFSEDFALALRLPIGGIMLPKCDGPSAAAVPDAWKGEVIPLIESARGVHLIAAILAADSRIRRVAFGAVDFALDLGVPWTPGGAERDYAMGRLVTVSRALGFRPPIDAVYPDVHDREGFIRDARRGRGVGFGAKMIIHPRQLAWLQEILRPADEDIEWARRVLQASQSEGVRGAFQLDGKLIDRPVVQWAERIIAAGPSAERAGAGPPQDAPEC